MGGAATRTVGAAVLGLFGILGSGCGVDGDDTEQASSALKVSTEATTTAATAAATTTKTAGTTTATTAATATTATAPIQVAPAAPNTADLVATGRARFSTGGANGWWDVFIDVVNVGNVAAHGASGNTQVAGWSAGSALFQYFGGTATTPNTVNPGERGYVKVTIPPYNLSRCGSYELFLDLGRSMQSGPGVFDNDHSYVKTQCLEWTSQINVDNFPPLVGLTVAEQNMISGKTLQGIVSSFQVGRVSDGNLCSACHFETASRSYRPPVAAGGHARIRANDVVGGRTWTGTDGWAFKFMARPSQPATDLGSKPVYLKTLFSQWVADGSRPGLELDINTDILATATTAVLVASP